MRVRKAITEEPRDEKDNNNNNEGIEKARSDSAPNEDVFEVEKLSVPGKRICNKTNLDDKAVCNDNTDADSINRVNIIDVINITANDNKANKELKLGKKEVQIDWKVVGK